MKRELKFRAWHIAEAKICLVDLLRPDAGAFLIGVIQGADTEFDKYTVIAPSNGRFCDLAEFNLMQFTGLKDKNGKEIYDGDIIHCHQADINIVHWYWDTWCYENYHASSLPLGGLGNPYSNGGLLNCEIIGNIYENPELIII